MRGDTMGVRVGVSVSDFVLEDNRCDVQRSCDTLSVRVMVGRQYVVLEDGPSYP